MSEAAMFIFLSCAMFSAWGIWAGVSVLKDIRKLLSATTSTKEDGK